MENMTLKRVSRVCVLGTDALNSPLTIWSHTMRKLLAACRRLDDHWVGDLIGVVFLFALIPLVLFLSVILEGAK